MTGSSLQASAHRAAVSTQDFRKASMLFCGYSLLQAAPAAACGEERPLFAGMLGASALKSGINLSTAQFTALRDSEHSALFPRSLSFVMALEGQSSEFDPGNGRSRIALKPGEAALFSFSDTVGTTGRYCRGQRSKSVLIQLRSDLIADERLAAFVDARTRESGMLSLGTCPQLNFLCGQLFDPTLCGTAGCLLLESRVLETVARAIQKLELDTPRSVSAAVAPAAASGRGPSSDAAKMARVRDRLMAEPEGDHSLVALAREAGVSVSGLKTKFRAVYGQTVFAFLHDLRMERARAGLESGGWTVTQAAHFTGYRHASNFSTAFQKHFGRSPGRGCGQQLCPPA
ncbi:helix-turn-helix transcriptional regulator [Azospirillum humicireducens]|nr:AraC family transcriptional regulator [Azospirillum humicireducens]